MTCVCATENSNALAWKINGPKIEFTADDYLLTRHNVHDSSAFAVLSGNSVTSGVRIIKSNLTFITSTNHCDLSVVECENVDRATLKYLVLSTAGK